VFVFHDVTNRPSPWSEAMGLATGTHLFRRQLEWIRSDFNVISPREVDRGAVPRRAAVLTFDDGFASFRHDVLPVLESLDLPALVFLNMDVVDGGTSAACLTTWMDVQGTGTERWKASTPGGHDRRLEEVTANRDETALADFQGPHLDNADLADLAGHPLVSYGNHLANHWSVPHLDDAQFDHAATDNQRRLDPLAGSVRWYASPHGVGTPERDARALELGMDRVLGGGGRLNPDPTSPMLDRVDVDQSISSRLAFRWRLTFRTLFPC